LLTSLVSYAEWFSKWFSQVADKANPLKMAIEGGERVLRKTDTASPCNVETRLMEYFDLLATNGLWPTTSAFEDISLYEAIDKLRDLPSKPPTNTTVHSADICPT
jgi:hypothetical protein